METAVTHRVIMEDRSHAQITGVTDLLIFDENEIVVETTMGILAIHGLDLHICGLDLERGQVLLDGALQNVEYEDSKQVIPAKESGFFTKLLHG